LQISSAKSHFAQPAAAKKWRNDKRTRARRDVARKFYKIRGASPDA
jgi:hypothetical protein